jgi:hypothetical protein
MFLSRLNMSISAIIDIVNKSHFVPCYPCNQLPLVINGVPGSGKSTLLKGLLDLHNVRIYTAGTPYGRSLKTEGALPLSEFTGRASHLCILDEYQLASDKELEPFQVLVGDPFQGATHRRPHFIAITSFRVPKAICEHLKSRDFQIEGDKEGELVKGSPFTTAVEGTLLHLGQISKDLAHSHNACSKDPTEVQGLEFDTVTLLYHSSELVNRVGFYVACTRACKRLLLLSDEHT